MFIDGTSVIFGTLPQKCLTKSMASRHFGDLTFEDDLARRHLHLPAAYSFARESLGFIL